MASMKKYFGLKILGYIRFSKTPPGGSLASIVFYFIDFPDLGLSCLPEMPIAGLIQWFKIEVEKI